MQKIIVLNLFLSLLSLLSVESRAQSLNLQRIVDSGLKNSKVLNADKSKIEAALAKYESTYSNVYPSVKLVGGYMRQSYVEPFGFTTKDPVTGQFNTLKLGQPIEDVTSFRGSVQQTIYAGGRTKYAIESAKLLTDATRLDAEKDKSEVQLNLINAFYTIYKLQITEALLAENKKAAERRIKDVGQLVKNGMALPNDELRTLLQLNQVEQMTLELSNTKAASLFALGLQLGETLEANTTIDTENVWTKTAEDLVKAAAIKPLEGYLTTGLAARSELKATQTRLKTAENGVAIAKGALLPTVALGANYVYANPNQRFFPLENKFNASWDAGITVSFDLTNAFTNKYGVHEANALFTTQKIMADAQKEGIQTEIAQAYYNLQSSLSKIATNAKAVEQALENNRVTNNKYTQQTATISEVLDADVLLLQTKINLATAKADAENGYYKLQKAIGAY